MKTPIDLNDWLKESISSIENLTTIHVSEINGYTIEGFIRFDIAYTMCKLLDSATELKQSLDVGHNVQHILLFLPLTISSELMVWHPDFWNKLDFNTEPPSLYLIKNGPIFDDDSEEYRCPISLPFKDRFQHRAIFRSFRNQEARDNSWEFTSGIYLIGTPVVKFFRAPQ